MTGRHVVLAGASGLVGRCILQGLLADPGVERVHVLARRPLQGVAADARLALHLVDFKALPALPPLAEAYLALGTTIKVAGSQEAFRAVDYDANFAVAQAALAAGARRCGLVSAMGADARSRVFYSRVKGELEAALAEMPFEGLVIARPSLLVGERLELGQPERPGEKIGLVLSRVLGPLIPRNYRPVEARTVARALLDRVPVASSRITLPSGAL